MEHKVVAKQHKSGEIQVKKDGMERKERRFLGWGIALLASVFVMFIIHLGTGFLEFSYWDLAVIILGGGDEWERIIVFDFRTVRSIMAMLIGVGLALSGAVFQTLTRNELASPGLLGVNAGASLAVTLLIMATPATATSTIWKLPIIAFIGGALAALAIFRMAYRKGQSISSFTLVLNGIALGAGIHAVQMMILMMLSSEQFNQVNTWLIGTIFGNSWSHVLVLGPIIGVGFLLLWLQSMKLNILNLSEETAIGLGSRINRERLMFLIIAVVLSTSSIAVGGSIGFIGLVAPHIARRVVGADHQYYLPITALLGALLLLTADWIGRVIIAPSEMLVGIVVSLIGAPYFLYVLARTKDE